MSKHFFDTLKRRNSLKNGVLGLARFLPLLLHADIRFQRNFVYHRKGKRKRFQSRKPRAYFNVLGNWEVHKRKSEVQRLGKVRGQRIRRFCPEKIPWHKGILRPKHMENEAILRNIQGQRKTLATGERNSLDS